MDINNQLSATGVAQVIVVLKAPPPPPTTKVGAAIAAGGLSLAKASSDKQSFEGIRNYFVRSETSINTQLARAGFQNIASLTIGRRVTKSTQPPPTVLHYPNLGIMLGTVNRDTLSDLRKDPRVDKVIGASQPRLIRPVRIAAAKLTTNVTWGIRFLDVPKLWDQGLRGKGIRIGHLDTGADGKHPALKKAIASFAEFDSFGQKIAPSPKPFDTDEHGTHTAATIAGRPVGGREIGIAPEASLASAIVIEGGNVIARILGGMDWAISQNVRILSMSLGIPFSPPMNDFATILQILRSRNVLPVIAVGNEGPGTSRPPGNHPEPISVGAIDRNNQVADFSSSQRFARPVDPLVPDLVAPGVDVISAKPGGGVQSMDGSSMATPHVAGLAALLFEAAPTASVDDVERAIYTSSRLDGIPVERGNRGCPNAVRALEVLTGISVGGSKSKSKSKPAAKSTKKKKKKTSSKRKTK